MILGRTLLATDLHLSLESSQKSPFTDLTRNASRFIDEFYKSECNNCCTPLWKCLKFLVGLGCRRRLKDHNTKAFIPRGELFSDMTTDVLTLKLPNLSCFLGGSDKTSW